jgi:nitrite reductase/ring-hydroxylating ferredoxin subunit
MARYNFPVPIGWFDVGVADELRAGEVKQVRIFDQDLMLWRGANNSYHLQETYCPHLGANIGADGKVCGNEIECPFHRWRFDGTGAVALIPYAPNAMTRARLRTYPVEEHYGVLMAWHHPDGAPPSFALPQIEELADPAMRGPLLETHEAQTALQELLENAVDGAHFQSIHHHPGMAALGRISFEGHTMIARSQQEFPSSKGPVPGSLDTYRTLIEITMLQFLRPIGRERVQLRFAVYYRNADGDAKVDRIAQAFYREVNRQVEEDIPIWNKKIYRERPALTEGEGAITGFRKWALQFYAGTPQENRASP